MLTSLRAKTFWLVAIVLLGYGIITWGDDPESARKPKAEPTGEVVKVALEIMMSDPTHNSTTVAVVASLGSIVGNFADRSATVWDGFKYPNRPWIHRFTARRGDQLNAEVVVTGRPVTLVFCVFWQEEEGLGHDEFLPGYGDITGAHSEASGGKNLARCQAQAR